MVDRWAMKMVRHPLGIGATILHRYGISANTISLIGFSLGMLVVPCLALNWYGLAEGSETITFFVFCCLFPQKFALLACICYLSTIIRVISGYRILRS